MTRAQELALDHIREAEIANEAAMDWLRERVAELESENAQLRTELQAVEPVEAAIAALTARNPRITFLPGPGPARLILGTTTIQGLGADAFLRALAALARSITPDPTDPE